MGKFMNVDADEVNKTLQGFDYTSISIDRLGATEYTIVSIVVDKTGSVADFKDELESMLETSINSCKQSPRAMNLLVRSTAFNAIWGRGKNIEELHGFTLLNSLDASQFKGTIDPDGSTPLYEATLESLDALHHYSSKLYDDKELICNAIVFIITDGDDNASRTTLPVDIKERVSQIKREEKLESLRTILIGLNDTDLHFKERLETFRVEANLDEYVSVGDVTPKKLAKLAQFVSQSVSSTSQVLGTGAPSQSLEFKF